MSTFKKALLAVSLIACTTQHTFAQTPVQLMTQFYKIADSRPFNETDLAKFFDQNFIDHDAADKSSAKEVVSLYKALATAAPDSQHHITFMEPVKGDKVLVRWKYKGTQTGPLFGAPAYGNKFNIAGMELWEFKEGKISGLWHVEELIKLFSQIAPKES